MRQLRDTRRLKSWLRAGKTVELRDRDQVIAKIVPENGSKKAIDWPDFAARRSKTLGDRVFDNIVLEERGRY